MPIAIEVVTPAEFRRYVASKGGAMPEEIAARQAAEAAAATAAADEDSDEADIDGTPSEAEPNEAPAAQPIA